MNYFLQKDRMTSIKKGKGYIYIYIYILGHSSLFYLFPIEKLVVTCQARIYYITCIPI